MREGLFPGKLPSALLSLFCAALAAPAAADVFFTVGSCRVYDSRDDVAGPLVFSTARSVQVTGVCGVPANASAISLNETMIRPSAAGWFFAFADTAPTGPVNGFPLRPNRTRGRVDIVAVGTGDSIGVLACSGENPSACAGTGSLHVVVDINGYFVAGAIAIPDAATVAEDSAATSIDVLANDNDGGAGPFSIASATQPANGTVVLTGGSPGAHTGLTYQPNANYCNTPPGTTPDTFTYTLNPSGSSTTVSVAVTCVDDDPVAVDDAATVAEDSGASAIPVLANDTDPDAGPISITGVTQPANGAVVITGGGSGLTYQPNANYCNTPPGTSLDTFTYTLTPGATTATVTMTVTCVDDPPTAVADAATVTEDDPATAVNVLANDTDIDTGPMAVGSVTQPANGTVVITGGGTGLTYQPNANYCNTPPGTTLDTFTYTLTPGGSSTTVTMTVTCADDDPVAVDDAATVPEDAPATAVPVLTNDTDVDGGPISITSVTQPANGAVVITGGGTGLTYQPNADYCNDGGAGLASGSVSDDTFTYTLTPGGDVATVSMTVTCADDNPVAVNDSATVSEDSGASAVGVLANDTDVDAGPKSVTSVTQPANGTVVITGGGTGLTYQPNSNYCNTPPGTSLDTFTYTLTPGGSTATVSMTVICIDDAPVAVADAATVTEDAAATAVNVLANDTDVDGGAISIVSATQPANGAVLITGGGTGLTYQPNANYCNMPPGTTPDTFTYTLAPGGSSTTVSMSVTCVNDGPVVDLNGPTPAGTSFAVTFTEGDPAVLLEDGVDPDAATITDVDTTTIMSLTVALTNLLDPTFEVLDANVTGFPSITKTYDTITTPGSGVLTLSAVTGQPIADFQAVLRTVTYRNTDQDPNGTARVVQFVANDGTNNGNTAVSTVTVVPVDIPPVAVADAATVAEDSGATAIAVLANDTDVDGGPKSVGSVTQPANGTVVITGGGTGLTYQPNANYCNTPPGTTLDTFTYTLTPGGSSATVTMTVTCVDDNPVAMADAATVAEDSGASAIPVLANDTDADGGPISITSVTQPANGAVVITGGGTGLTYQPNANYCNTPPGTTLDMFTYTLTPGGSSTTVTMTVTCVDDNPVAVADAATVVEDSGANAINVLANDTDVDAGPKSVTSVTQPANGAVVITGGGTGLTYAPNANYCNNPPGTTLDTFTYTLTPGGSSTTVTMTVTCVDDPPAAVADAATVVEDSGANAIPVLTNDTDIDAGPKSISSVTQPSNGVVVITGGGTGLTYAPNLNYCNNPPGTTLDTFTYTLTPGSSSTTVTMTVTCVNDPPVADADLFDYLGNTELRVDLAAAATPHAPETTPSTFGVIDGDSDPVEGNAIAVSAIVGCADPTAPFVCALAGVGTVTMESNGRFSFEPAPGDAGAAPTSCSVGAVGQETFQYTLTDNGVPSPASATGTVTLCRFERVWYVRNNAPAGNGTSTSPFNSITATNLSDNAGDGDLTDDLDFAGDYIFVHFGDGTSANQTGGLVLENGQHLIGDHAGLSIPVALNGNANPTVLFAGTAGNRPLLDDTVVDAFEGVSATIDVIPVEIVGLNLGGNVNAIDWNTPGAFAGTGTFTIRDNVIRSAAADGVDINLAGTGAVNLAFHDNNLTAAGSGLDIQETGAGSLTIRAFHDNVVTGNNAGAGLNVNTAIFDAAATAGIQSVPGGTTVIGDPGNRIGGPGLILTNVTGALNFANLASGTIGVGDLDIFTDSGAALSVTGVGGFDFDVTANAGVLVANAGPAAVLATADVDLQVNSLTSTNSATTGVSLATVTGTFSAPSGSAITNAAGTDFVIASTSAAVAYGGTITDDVGQLVSVSSSGGSLKSFTGAITDGDDGDGGGISLTSNSSTIRFSGGLVLDTGANPAFAATGGGTVEVCDENPCSPGATGLLINKIETTTGTALNVASTTIGTNNLEFRSISANGGTNGIVLNATGATGGLQVKGTGSTGGSGGTITGCTKNGAEFISANNITLKNMNITNNGTAQNVAGSASTCGADLVIGDNLSCVANLFLRNTTAVVLDNLVVTGSGQQGINGNGVNGLTVNNCSITGNGTESFENGILLMNTSGTVSITGSTVENNRARQMHIANGGSTTMTLNTSNTKYDRTSAGTTNTQQGILMQLYGTSTTTINASALTFAFNEGAGFWTNAFQLNAADGSVVTAGSGITTSSFTNFAAAVIVNAGGTADVNFDIIDNATMASTNLQAINYTILGGGAGITAKITGTISGNNISNCNPVGSTCHAIDLNTGTNHNGELHLKIDDNTITGTGGGIVLLADGAAAAGAAKIHLKITRNDISSPGNINGRAAIELQGGLTSANPNITFCTDVGGAGLENVVSGQWNETTSQSGIFIRQRFSAVGSWVLPGYGGPGNNSGGQVETYLNGRNNTAAPLPTFESTATTSTGAFANGGACTTP